MLFLIRIFVWSVQDKKKFTKFFWKILLYKYFPVSLLENILLNIFSKVFIA